jgi:hypothetical protein
MPSQYITLAATSANSEQASGQGRAHSVVATEKLPILSQGRRLFAARSEVREGALVAAATAPFIDAAQRIAAGR